MEFLQYVIALVVTLGILVTFHEYGHFWVARRCGVRVLRFSVGFGKPLWGWKGRDGTEYVVAAIPLGGYVKMLDEREGEVPPDQLDQAFNRKPVLQRIAIVSAGPLANFLFAILAYWFMYSWGVQVRVPVIGDIKSDSIAYEAGLQSGDEILAVDGEETLDWGSVHLQLLSHLGDTGEINFLVKSRQSDERRELQISVVDWLSGQEDPDPMRAIGLKPYRPDIPPVLSDVLPNTPASKAGLQSADRIIAIDGKPIQDWDEFVDVVQASADRPLQLSLMRGNESMTITVTPGARAEAGKSIGYIGAAAVEPQWPDWMYRTVQFNLPGALSHAVKKTWDMSLMILGSIKKMIVGDISVKNLSGPITIAKAAGDSVSFGIESFLKFLAYLSISLGVLNLLPIPVLDGGHLLYYFIEAVRGRPLSEEKQILGLKIGLTIIVMIMLLAFYNDLARF